MPRPRRPPSPVTNERALSVAYSFCDAVLLNLWGHNTAVAGGRRRATDTDGAAANRLLIGRRHQIHALGRLGAEPIHIWEKSWGEKEHLSGIAHSQKT